MDPTSGTVVGLVTPGQSHEVAPGRPRTRPRTIGTPTPESPVYARLDARKGRTARRLAAPRLPTAVEDYLAEVIRKVVATYMRDLVTVALRAVDKFAKPSLVARADDDDEGEDAEDIEAPDPREWASEARKVSSHMRAVVRRALRTGLPAIEARSKLAAERARRHSVNELGRLGYVVKKEPPLKEMIDAWRKHNVSRITGLAEEHVSRLEAILANGFNKHPRTIARQIKDLGIMSEARATLIARDQVLTLNSQINRYRQKAAGVDRFVWVTQNDSRVRDEHAELDGQELSWDEGDPDEGFPGEPVNCRCLAAPVPPDDDGTNREEDD